MSYPNQSSSYPPQSEQPHQVVYAGDEEARLRAEYEQARAQNPDFLVRMGILDALGYAQYKQKAQQYQQQQVQQLDQGVQNRAPLSPTGTNYLSFDHPQLKDMVNNNVDPGAVGNQGHLWNDFGNKFVTFSDDLNKSVNNSHAGWQGQAGDSARAYMSSLSTWTGQSGQGMQLMGNQVYALSQTAATAKNSMPEPVNFGVGDALKMMVGSPFPWQWADTANQIQQKFDQKQQAHQQAAQVLSTQAQSFQQISSTMPEFTPPPNMQAGDGRPPTAPPPPTGHPVGVGGGGGYGGGGGGVGAFGGVPGGGGGGVGGRWNPGGPGGPSLPGQPSLPIGTRPVHDYPVGTNPVNWTGDGTGGGRTGGLGGGAGGGGGHGGADFGAIGGMGAFGGGGAGAGGGGVGGGGGRFGAGGAGGAGTGGAGSGRLGPGGMAGAAEPEGRMPGARGAMGAGAAGRGGAAGGMGPMGGGQRGGGGEDGEHQRPGYLVETDEDVWTDGIPPTAPPVIGG